MKLRLVLVCALGLPGWPSMTAQSAGGLVNVSIRSSVGAGPGALVCGFFHAGSRNKTVLVRAAGPTLATSFQLTGTLAEPQLTVADLDGRIVAQNTRWWGTRDTLEGEVFAFRDALAQRVGAFSFPSRASADSALMTTLRPGAYTATVSALNGSSGICLVEVYDGDAQQAAIDSRLVTISVRTPVDATNVVIGGFVLNGTSPRRILVRGVGPSLPAIGVTGGLTQPKLALYDASGTLLRTASSWSDQPDAGDVRTATAAVGAFPLREASSDAVILAILGAGAYTVHLSSVIPASGTALLELFEVPSSATR